MKSKFNFFNKLLGRTVIYMGSNIFGKIIGFLLLPIFTVYLSLYDFVIIEIFNLL